LCLPLSVEYPAVAVGHCWLDHDLSDLRYPAGPGLLFPPPSLLTGVGYSPRDHEQPVTPVRGADGLCRNAVPLRIVPARGQFSENRSKPATKESCDVLQHDESGSHFANDPCEFPPKAGAVPIQSGSGSSNAEILAGEASADEIDGGEVLGSNGFDIFEPLGLWPVVCKNTAAERVRLDLPHCLADAGPLEPELEPADSGEQRANPH
jgi:hypothetical protein